MEEPINFIEKLELILRWVCLFILGAGIIGVIFDGINVIENYNALFLYSNTFEYFKDFIEAIITILFGLLILFIGKALLKKERWAFYFLSFLLIIQLLSNGIYLLFNFSFESVGSLTSTFLFIGAGYLFYLLIKGKPVFIQQPKEKFIQWFQKPYCKISLFLFIFIIILFISMTIFSLYMESKFKRARIDIEDIEKLFEPQEVEDIKKIFDY